MIDLLIHEFYVTGWKMETQILRLRYKLETGSSKFWFNDFWHHQTGQLHKIISKLSILELKIENALESIDSVFGTSFTIIMD